MPDLRTLCVLSHGRQLRQTSPESHAHTLLLLFKKHTRSLNIGVHVFVYYPFFLFCAYLFCYIYIGIPAYLCLFILFYLKENVLKMFLKIHREKEWKKRFKNKHLSSAWFPFSA